MLNDFSFYFLLFENGNPYKLITYLGSRGSLKANTLPACLVTLDLFETNIRWEINII